MNASSEISYSELVSNKQRLVQKSNSVPIKNRNPNNLVDITVVRKLLEERGKKEHSKYSLSLATQRENQCLNSTVSNRMKCAIVMLTILVVFSFLFLFIYARPEGTIEKAEMGFSTSIENLTKMANEYNLKVIKEGSCKTPVAKLIPILPSPHRIYTPHCVILHRCSDDTGCCYSNKKVCRPKTTENVTLPIKISEMMKNGKFSASKPVLLTFVNHTECGCERISR